jgi:3-oxoacyl-[acyl-carrier-protein] synthase-3
VRDESAIAGIEYHLAGGRLTNDDLTREYPDWSVEKIVEKTGISERRIAGTDECSSDLGFKAAVQLFASGVCSPREIDYLLFCTQSPDYFLPTTACVLQQRLGLGTGCGALDFNLGCSGYVYGLGLAKALVENGQAVNVLLVTAETYSKFIHPKDRSVRTLFSDGASATLIRRSRGKGAEAMLTGPFEYGTDGRGAENLIVPTGGMRKRDRDPDEVEATDDAGNVRTSQHLYMNGPEIFNFTLSAVPKAVNALLAKCGKQVEDVDVYIFHQANKYMLDFLRKKIKIPAEKFYVNLDRFGNTVSSTIPIALSEAVREGRVRSGDSVMLVGFGVGYSWGATIIQWAEEEKV